ncbi:BrnT family toxin [bacterium]|nr:BrnT family toxin [bacterium]
MFLYNHSSKGWLTINIKRILCTEAIADKLSSKHRVSVGEARQLLLNQPRFRFAEKGDVPGEDVYAAFGQTYGGRYLVVFFVYKPIRTVAIIISARDMTSVERRRYGRK